MKNKTLQVIRKHGLIGNDAHIIIGLSGGPDSVCLFDILYNIAEDKPELGWKLYAVHVNHKLREGAAEADQKYVERLCGERGVPCRTVVTDCKMMAAEFGMSSEEAGRKARYDAFSALAMEIAEGRGGAAHEKVPKEKIVIALAHNANDQCETILFRLMRGSGVDGLAGMAYKRFEGNGFAVVRPILDFSREEIEAYCEKRELSPRIDHTNRENTYTRNKIRNMLIPFMEENFNENITETVNRLGKIASCDRDFLRSTAAEEYERAKIGNPAKTISSTNFDTRIEQRNFDAHSAHTAPDASAARTAFGVDMQAEALGRPAHESAEATAAATARMQGPYAEEKFDTEKLKNLHKSIRTRIYTMALERLGMEENISFYQLEAVDELLFSRNPSASADLSAGFTAAREYGRLTFAAKSARKTECKECEASERNKAPSGSKALGASKAQAGNEETAISEATAESREQSGDKKRWRLMRMSRSEYEEYRKKGIFHGAFCGVDADRLEIRTRRGGDKLDIGTGFKKLQDFFVDEKLPKRYRDEVELLALGSDILWILPSPLYDRAVMKEKGRFSAACKVRNDSCEPIIVLEKL